MAQTCSNCNAQYSDDAKFCTECGANLQLNSWLKNPKTLARIADMFSVTLKEHFDHQVALLPWEIPIRGWVGLVFVCDTCKKVINITYTSGQSLATLGMIGQLESSLVRPPSAPTSAHEPTVYQ